MEDFTELWEHLKTLDLTEKERAIVDLRAQGKDIAEICKITGVTRQRVRQLETRIFNKMKVR